MQKKIIALAVAALASTAAFAQTNVTIYGIADANLAGTTYLGAATKQTQYGINSGALSTSRIGFKGVEDLGNGLKALFTLEYGLGIDGSNGIGFSPISSAVARQQFVGLTGGFGTVIAGHLQTTGLDFTVAGTALGGSTGLGATYAVSGGLMTSAATHLISALAGGRHSNAIAYVSPSFGGVTVAYNHARVTETAGTTGNTDAHGDLLSVSYANGPITAGAIYTRVTMPATALNDNTKEWGLRAGYDFGVVKLQGTYQRAKADYTYSAATAAGVSATGVPFAAVPAVGTATTGSDSKYVISVSAPIGAKVAVIGEYAHLSVKSTSDADNVNAATLATTYSLSKRTTAYAGFVARRSQVLNADSNSYLVGVRHSF